MRKFRLEFLRPAVALGLLALAASPSPAGESKITFTPGVGAAWLPDDLAVQQRRPVVGGIVGLSSSPRWAIEVRAHLSDAETPAPGDTEIDLLHGEGNLTWYFTEGTPLVPFATAGAGMMKVDEESRFAANGGLGFVTDLSRRAGFRLEARDVAYKFAPAGGGAEEWQHQIEVFAGVSYAFGGKPKDGDRDGVPDKTDRCPDTPVGARIDVHGCPIDSDADGVYDGFDQCAATPRGATVDAKGCPKDSDADGVLDGLDQCAATPAGARVDAAGCPGDSDGDGVFDGLDQCDGTVKGCLVDARGCALDSDGDGICDGVDRCPATPATARVDRFGCPIVVTEKETELLETGMIRLQNINFATGKSAIRPDSYAALDEVGTLLVRWPELRIEIGGHTDAQGGEAANQTLSEARARAVLDYLLAKFSDLQGAQFTAVGYGEGAPVSDNTTELGRAKNRRVEFKVLNTDVLTRERERQKIVPR